MYTQTKPSQQKESADPSLSAEEQLVRDALKTVLHNRVARYHLQNMRHYPNGSLGLCQEHINGAIGQLRKVENTLLAGIKAQYPDEKVISPLAVAPTAHLLFDLNYLSDLLLRLGTSEEDRYYQEFVAMLIDCLNSVFWSKQRRSRIQFTKYRHLFRLIEKESVADAYGEGESHFKVVDGKLFINLPEAERREVMS